MSARGTRRPHPTRSTRGGTRRFRPGKPPKSGCLPLILALTPPLTTLILGALR